MAKPKLSTEEKTSLREQLEKRLKAGEQQSRVLEDLGSKFKVSPETVRYYSKQLTGGDGKAPRGKTATKKTARAGRGKKAARRAQRRTGVSKQNGRGQALSLKAVIRRYEPRELERALKASKLAAEMRAEQGRGKDLQVQLRRSNAAVRKLSRHINRLLRG